MTAFKVGDRVTHVTYGKGRVTHIDNTFNPYLVKFKNPHTHLWCGGNMPNGAPYDPDGRSKWFREDKLTLRPSKWMRVEDGVPPSHVNVRVKLASGRKWYGWHARSGTGIWYVMADDADITRLCDDEYDGNTTVDTADPVIAWRPLKAVKPEAKNWVFYGKRPAIPEGWTPASEPPRGVNPNRNVEIMYTDGTTAYGWYSPIAKKWFFYGNDRPANWSDIGGANDYIDGVLCWREMQPAMPARIPVGSKVIIVRGELVRDDGMNPNDKYQYLVKTKSNTVWFHAEDVELAP
jgi:hypothetical protein